MNNYFDVHGYKYKMTFLAYAEYDCLKIQLKRKNT